MSINGTLTPRGVQAEQPLYCEKCGQPTTNLVSVTMVYGATCECGKKKGIRVEHLAARCEGRCPEKVTN